MGKILAALIVVVCTIFIFGAKSEETLIETDGLQAVDLNDFWYTACKNGLALIAKDFCDTVSSTIDSSTTTTTTTVSTSEDVVNEDTTSTASSSTDESTTTMSASALERAHWCSFKNGSYAALNQRFMYTECTTCRCTEARVFLCAKLQCMPTYCIDGTKPVPKEGQCCPQCAYENTPTSCVVNGYLFPHGTIVRQTAKSAECWCQLGSVECRKSSVSLFGGLDYWGKGTAVYVVVIIICAVLMLGTVLCCGGTLVFYYYYKRNQQTVQETYAQYYQNAGWQPMAEDGQVITDSTADEKKAEAEQQQYEYEQSVVNTEQTIPPPYALYNGTYVDGQNEKH